MNSLVMAGRETSWEIRLLCRYRWNERLIPWLPRLVYRRAERTSRPPGVRPPGELRADRRAELPPTGGAALRLAAVWRLPGGAAPAAKSYPMIRCPTLVVWGDRHFPPVHARDLHQAIPGSRPALVPGDERWMAWHRAAEVASRLLAWDDLASA